MHGRGTALTTHTPTTLTRRSTITNRDRARAIAHQRARAISGIEPVGGKTKKEHQKLRRPAKQVKRRSFPGVQLFPAWDWPHQPEAVVKKDTNYQHQELQPASHLWADLISASSKDERRGNTPKGAQCAR